MPFVRAQRSESNRQQLRTFIRQPRNKQTTKKNNQVSFSCSKTKRNQEDVCWPEENKGKKDFSNASKESGVFRADKWGLFFLSAFAFVKERTWGSKRRREAASWSLMHHRGQRYAMQRRRTLFFLFALHDLEGKEGGKKRNKVLTIAHNKRRLPQSNRKLSRNTLQATPLIAVSTVRSPDLILTEKCCAYPVVFSSFSFLSWLLFAASEKTASKQNKTKKSTAQKPQFWLLTHKCTKAATQVAYPTGKPRTETHLKKKNGKRLFQLAAHKNKTKDGERDSVTLTTPTCIRTNKHLLTIYIYVRN